MTEIQYNTRTGAVMAGSTGAAVSKKMFAAIREASTEARNKSNQELTLLLTHYNQNVNDVVEAFRTGDSDVVLGGWATTGTKKGKGKKNKQGGGDSEGTPTETGSVASNNKVQPASNKNGTSSQPSTSNRTSKPGDSSNQPSLQQNGTSSKQQPPPQSKMSAETPSSNNSSLTPQNQPSTNEESRLETSPSKGQKARKNDVLNPREVTVPDIHTHASSFNRLMQESVNTYQHDVTNLDSVFSQLQASLNERYNWLRRTLDLNHQESQTILAERMNLAATLSDQIAQSSAMGPQEYTDWQQNVTMFVSDYKFDAHIAESPKFTYAFDDIMNDLNNFGHIVSTLPSYSYKPSMAQRDKPQPEAAPSRNNQQSNNRGTANGKNNQQGNGQNSNRPQQPRNPNNNSQSNQRNNPSQQSQNTPPPRQNSFQSQSQQHPLHERVTIVPNGLPTSSAAPLSSLVISGSNLTPEELAALTQSLQSTLGFPAPSSSNTLNTGMNGGGGQSSFPADIFAGGAVWTNSNTPQGQENWQSPNMDGSSFPGQQSQYQNSGGNTSAFSNNVSSNSNGNYSQNNGGQARSGGGGGGSRGRGNSSARGGSRGGSARGGRPSRGGPGASRS